ncbi:hypothetical protein AB3N04_00915 (plasmid) [Alkalihalophilus sp. As8PL]|uniref:S1 motif domain-containing protein n=1 Tax=Alkalihalophilus sp. As8PL TaxID=3237103 RepID=A0AB39BNL2_9BACI
MVEIAMVVGYLVLHNLNELRSFRFYEAWYTTKEEMNREIDREKYEFDFIAKKHIYQLSTQMDSQMIETDEIKVIESRPVVSSTKGTGAESLFQELQNTFSIVEENSSEENVVEMDVSIVGEEDLIKVGDTVEVKVSEELLSYEPPIQEVESPVNSNELNALDVDPTWVTSTLEVYDREEEKKKKKQDEVTRKVAEIEQQIRKLQSSDKEDAHEQSVQLMVESYALQGKVKERIALKHRYPELFKQKSEMVKTFVSNDATEPKSEPRKRVSIIGGVEESELLLPPPPNSVEITSIGEKKLGEQAWYGQVVGIDRKDNGMFFHFRDHTQREWLQFNNHPVEVGDILVVKVRVTPNRLVVKNVFRWKVKSIKKERILAN